MIPIADTELVVLEDQRSALIRAEVLAIEQRERLEYAVRDAVLKMGRSIDSVSDASGLAPTEIERILATPSPLADLAVLSGVA